MRSLPFHFEVQANVFEKADAPKGQRRRIGGIISTEAPDRQGEVLLQKGLNFDPFVQNGWFNDNHSKATADGKLGYPEGVSYFSKGQKYPNGETAQVNAHWVEGYLLEDWPPADKIWKLGKSLQGTDRSLGFSVEGQVHRRIGDKTVFKKSKDGKSGDWVGNTIAKATVAHVAITDCPVNLGTGLELLAKSMEAVEANAQEWADLEARIDVLEKAMTMGPPSEKAPVGPKTGEGAAAVQAKESLEQDDDKDDEDKKKKKKLRENLDKSLSQQAAVDWVLARRPNLPRGEAIRFVRAITALKSQGRL